MMSTPMHGHLATRWATLPTGLLLAALLVAGLAGGRWNRVAAQDASPVATPTAVCAPGAGDGAMTGMDMASPAASPAATPDAAGTPADAETAAALVAATENAISCYNAGNGEAFLTLATDKFIVDELRLFSREEAIAGLALAAGTLSEIQIDPDSVLIWDDGRVSIDVDYIFLGYQFVPARWFFVVRGSDYLIDEETYRASLPDVDFVTVISADVADDESVVVIESGASFPATDLIIIHIKNRNGTVVRDFAVVQLPAGTMATPAAAEGEAPTVDTAALAAGTDVAYMLVDPGDEEDVILLNLPVGSYALVDVTNGAAVPFSVVETAG